MQPRRTRYKKKPSLGKRVSLWFSKLSRAKKVAIILVAVLLVTATGASAWYYNRITDIEKLFPEVTWPSAGGDIDSNWDVDAAFQDSKIINIALLGLDGSEERSATRAEGYTGLVDTIMVAAVNIQTGQVDVVSIPRDSLVPIYNYGGWKDKINSANYWGWLKGLPGIDDPVEAGIKSQLKTIQSALGGVPIHYYVAVDMDAVVEIVDIMGGVNLDVPERTYHKFGRVIAEPGRQWFSGRRFLDYMRSREAAGADYQRAKKQQSVMIEVFDQFKKANKLMKAPQVLACMSKKVYTNLSLDQIVALAWFGTQDVDTSKIATHILAGKLENGTIPGRRSKALDYYIVDQLARVRLVKNVWGMNIIPQEQDVLLPPIKKTDGTGPSDPSSDPADYPLEPPDDGEDQYSDTFPPDEDPGVGGGEDEDIPPESSDDPGDNQPPESGDETVDPEEPEPGDDD